MGAIWDKVTDSYAGLKSSVHVLFMTRCLSPLQTPVDTKDLVPAPNIDHLLSNIGRTALLGEASGEGPPTTAQIHPITTCTELLTACADQSRFILRPNWPISDCQ